MIKKVRQGYRKRLGIARLEETGIHIHNKTKTGASEHTCKPGVSSFRVMANEVKLYLVTLGGGLVLFHSNEAFDAGSLTFVLLIPSPAT